MSGGITFAGVALSRDNTKITLTTNQPVGIGTNYTLTINNLTTVSGNPLARQFAALRAHIRPRPARFCCKSGRISTAATAVSDLTNPALNPNYPNNPTSSSYLTSFEAPFNTGQVDYGERIEGYVYPPTTGSYTFWIASDDNSQLWLSTDANPNDAVQIASVASYTNYRQWNAYASQQSAPITLVAGQRYFIMALMKQGTGGDNLSVAWQPPGTTFDTTNGTPIPGNYLAPVVRECGSHSAGCTGEPACDDCWQQHTSRVELVACHRPNQRHRSLCDLSRRPAVCDLDDGKLTPTRATSRR